MNYEFITTIATIVTVGASLAGFMLQAIKAASRSTDARFVAIDARFREMEERLDARFREMEERLDARFREMEERFDARFREMEERFEQVHRRFEKADQRAGKFEERLYDIQKEFTGVQKEFNGVHAGIARLGALVEGIGVSLATAAAPRMEHKA